MKINSAIISALKPCKDRFDNFVANYGDTTFSLEDFLLLDKITYDDKVWVVTRLFSKEQNAKWALLCASSILSLFETKYPNDKRPRKVLEAAEVCLRHPTEESKNAVRHASAYAYSDAHVSAYAKICAGTTTEAAYAAYTITEAAVAVTKAVYAATYPTFAFVAASYAATVATAVVGISDNKTKQQEVNLLFMVECAKEPKI